MSAQHLSVFAAVVKTSYEFFNNTSLNGAKFVYTSRNHRMLRNLWSFVVLTVIVFSIYVMLSIWDSFSANPTLITLENEELKIWNTPFPAVGICSVNKLSATAAIKYSKLLFKKSEGVLPETKILENIRYFATLFDSSSFDADEALEVQNFLDKYDSPNYYDYYNVEKAMDWLAPKCEDILKKCRWNAEEVPCQQLFRRLATPNGFCCVFNYARSYSENSSLNEIIRPQAIGVNNGLTVLLNSSTADYFYNGRSTNGFEIQLFQSSTFPDSCNGGVADVLLSPNENIHLKVEVEKLSSESSIRSYSLSKRRCYFEDEHYELLGEQYNYSDCLTLCKLRSIEALCNCIPFYIPSYFIETNKTIIYCSLAHVSCLERYRVTWNSYRPQEDDIKGLEKEMEDSLSCPKCLPLCSDFMYRFHTSGSAIYEGGTLQSTDSFLSNETHLEETSMLKVFFGSADATVYNRNLLYKWYEILAYFGGLLGICLGASFISFVELLYFCTVKFYENYRMYNTLNRNDLRS